MKQAEAQRMEQMRKDREQQRILDEAAVLAMSHSYDLKKCLQSPHRPAFITPPVELRDFTDPSTPLAWKEGPLEWQHYQQRIQMQEATAAWLSLGSPPPLGSHRMPYNHKSARDDCQQLLQWLPTENARELEAVRSDVNHNAGLQDELARVVAALTQRMDRLCSEMDSVRQENVQLHARIAQLEQHAPSTVEVEEAAIEAQAERQIQQVKDEELARELAELWSSSGNATVPVQGRVSPREAAAAAAEARCAAASKRGRAQRGGTGRVTLNSNLSSAEEAAAQAHAAEVAQEWARGN